MPRALIYGSVALMLCALLSCNQPFEPNGPTGDKIVVYGILNLSSTVQYVRLSTTYQAPPNPGIGPATVSILSDSGIVPFRDTTVLQPDSLGIPRPVEVYVGRCTVKPGTDYTLNVQTPSGLNVSATTTTLLPPTIVLQQPYRLDTTSGPPLKLTLTYGSDAGATEFHFYIEYYAFVDGGWEYHRTEVPRRSYIDGNGDTVRVYPSLSLVRSDFIAQVGTTVPLDMLQYAETRNAVAKKYPGAPIIWVQAVFEVIQIDDALYSYYFVNNGAVDRTSIRLDQPEYTNIPGGLGVFGSRLTVTRAYPIRH